MNEYFSVPGNIQEVDLTIHTDSYCGGYDVYLELIQGRTTCQTSAKRNFDSGAKLSWTGSQLGSCVDTLFDSNSDEINFKIRSTGGDDFCPNSLSITLKDAKTYENRGMDDKVDNRIGSELRTAKRKLGKTLILFRSRATSILGECAMCESEVLLSSSYVVNLMIF